MDMPEYQCHKKVKAVRIAAVEFDEAGRAKIAPQEVGVEPFLVLDATWKDRFKGNDFDLGFYVVYGDGYSSWSPTLAFESGYTKI